MHLYNAKYAVFEFVIERLSNHPHDDDVVVLWISCL